MHWVYSVYLFNMRQAMSPVCCPLREDEFLRWLHLNRCWIAVTDSSDELSKNKKHVDHCVWKKCYYKSCVCTFSEKCFPPTTLNMTEKHLSSRPAAHSWVSYRLSFFTVPRSVFLGHLSLKGGGVIIVFFVCVWFPVTNNEECKWGCSDCLCTLNI